MAKQPTQRQANTKGSKGSFSAGATARSASDKQSVATGGGGIGGFFSNLFGGGGGGSAPQNRMPDGSRMDTITKPMGSKTAPSYGQRNLGMAAPGTPGLSDKLALNAAAQAAASQPQGIMGVLSNLMPGSMAIRAGRGLMKHMRPAEAFPPRFGVDGQMTPYGQQMQQNSQLLAQQMANQGGDDSPIAPPSVPEVAPVDPNAMPTERPPWWPAYLPWPPTPQSQMPAPAPMPIPTQNYGSLPVPNSYSTSYSNLQNAISGAQNPLMMGIGGIRTP